MWLGVLIILLAGCASERDRDIPGDARLLVEGNRKVTAVAPSDGTVYIHNVSIDKRVYSGEVHRGDSISVDRENRGVMINDRLVSEQQINTGNDYRIWFAPRTHDTRSNDWDHTRDRDRMR
jgi:hypothetical protein